MKKMNLSVAGLILAIGLSLLTTAQQKADPPITYQDEWGLWRTYMGEPCIGNVIPECFKLTNDGMCQLFYNNNTDFPVYRNP